MTKSAFTKVIILIILILAVIGICVMKQLKQTTPARSSLPVSVHQEKKNLPMVVELGRGKCIPCKMMAPILAELKKKYAGRAIIDVIDIGKNPDAAKKYRIRIIPTQIFITAEGEEIFRHEGFMPKKEIIEKLSEMGVKEK
jgi:thioredoxin 1